MTFHVILGRPPVSKMKWLEKCHWRCSFIFLVSPVFIAALDVSVMGEMILQWVPYFCQNNVKHKFSIQCTYRRRQWGNVKHKFSSQCTYRRRQWGLKICQRYVKISKFYCVKLILQNMIMINAKERTEAVLFLEQ